VGNISRQEKCENKIIVIIERVQTSNQIRQMDWELNSLLLKDPVCLRSLRMGLIFSRLFKKGCGEKPGLHKVILYIDSDILKVSILKPGQDE